MTIKQQVELETLPFIILAIFVGLFLSIFRNNLSPKYNLFSIIPGIVEDKTPTPLLPQPKFSSQISPDGIKKVTMTTISNENNTNTYIFSTSDSSSGNEQTIFKKTVAEEKKMSIPFNTFSPDNKYFFIQEETGDGVASDILVFKALGEPFEGGEKYLDLTGLFKDRKTGNNFEEATGWASETLIIVNTTTQDYTKGPSYWFEVPSKAILQLATDF